MLGDEGGQQWISDAHLLVTDGPWQGFHHWALSGEKENFIKQEYL